MTKKFTVNKKRVRILILCAVLVYAAITLICQQVKLNEQEKKLVELTNVQKELEAEKELLDSRLRYLMTDEYVEQLVREKLGCVKNGEIIFKIEDPAKKKQPQETDKNDALAKSGDSAERQSSESKSNRPKNTESGND